MSAESTSSWASFELILAQVLAKVDLAPDKTKQFNTKICFN